MAKLSDNIPVLKNKQVNADLGGKGTTASPVYLKLVSINGTARYIFVEDDGTVKVHTAIPTANTDGSEVGSQS